jgi:hypothetical protein
MATAGRPPVPIEQKRLRGTLRADRLANDPLELVQPEGLPVPPEGLGEAGREFWEVVHSAARWISHETDRTLVTIAAQQIEEREQLRALVIASPEDYRLRSGLRELEKALTSNLALMGFTPADRSRLGFAEVKKATKLEEFMQRIKEGEREQERLRQETAGDTRS